MSEHQPAGDSPVRQMAVSMTGAGASEHDTEPPGADAHSVKVGHEPDQFDVKAILYVPLVVVIVLVFTYVLVNTWFGPLTSRENEKIDNPQVAELNKASFNDRVGRIDSSRPKALDGKPDTVVPQPRLEKFQQQAGGGPNDPEFYRSKLAIGAGNPVAIRPEDLRADRYLDPTFQRKLLAEYSWADDAKKTARVPIDEAMKMVLRKLPVRKDPVQPPVNSSASAKLSNGGQADPGQSLAGPPPPLAPPRLGGGGR